MVSTSTYILATFAVLIAAVAGYITIFGVPPHIKRMLEERALETMGENKASYLVKDMVGKMPASDQKDVKELQKGLSNALGGSLQNPLGKFAGDTADDASRPATGR